MTSYQKRRKPTTGSQKPNIGVYEMMKHEGNEAVKSNEPNDDAEASSTTEVEVNFRLDPHGRTLPPDTEMELPHMDYTTRAMTTRFESRQVNDDKSNENSTTSNRILRGDDEMSVMDDLLFDCDIADSCLMPRTFWYDRTMKPRCNLEQMASDILEYYCPQLSLSSPSTEQYQCGAEWWVQIRPSPEMTSRYTAPTYTDGKESEANTRTDDDNNGDIECNTATDANGISFHWDKDEDLRILCNGTVYVHPHLSTVTYLTDGGDHAAPTFIAEHVRVNNLTGEWIDHESCQETTSAFISWPSKGKHLCFDGRYLHAAPSNLVNKSKKLTKIVEPNKEPKFMIRRTRRYTFLVNIWMYHHPFNVHPFPESMIDKLSGSETNRKNSIRLILEKVNHQPKNEKSHNVKSGANIAAVSNVAVVSDDTIQLAESDETATSRLVMANVETFVWPMGDHDSNETIHVSLPIETVQSLRRCGGNVRIRWDTPTNGIDESKNHNRDTSSAPSSTKLGMFLRKDVASAGSEQDSKRPKLNDVK
jgi:hypothetical protein